MRRLLLLVAVLVAVDTMLYAALTPLLPHFADEFGLSKTRAGALVAAYAAGALVGGLPGGVAAVRLGARRAVLVGLTGMGVASLGFAFAGSFWTLFAARFVQGCGSAFTWAGAFAWLLAAAPRNRRGQLLGSAMGAAVFGALFGPVIGAAAALAGRAVVFTLLAGLALVLSVWTLRLGTAPPGEQPSVPALARALRNRLFAAGLALMALPSLLFGVLSVLAPLHLDAAGWGATAIGAVWLASAALESVQAPLVGRLSDLRGRRLPVAISLGAATVLSLLLALDARPLVYVPLIIVGSLAYGILFTPAFALIADGAERSGLAQGMAFGFMNAAWAVGAVIGPAAGGALARATGDWLPFVLSAVVCAVAFAAVTWRSADERAAVLVDRLPGDPASVGRE
jgi:MFS family permease